MYPRVSAYVRGVFREEATSALDMVFMWVLHLGRIGILSVGLAKRGKPDTPARNNNKLNLQMASRRNRTRATLVEGERSHHCAISAAESVFEKHTFVKHNQAISINPHRRL